MGHRRQRKQMRSSCLRHRNPPNQPRHPAHVARAIYSTQRAAPSAPHPDRSLRGERSTACDCGRAWMLAFRHGSAFRFRCAA